MNDPRESMEGAPLLGSSHGRYSMFRNSCGKAGTWAADFSVPLRENSIQGLRSGIDSQYLHKIGDLAKMVQGIACGLIVSAQKVHVKDVLPGPAAHGPRLDLA